MKHIHSISFFAIAASILCSIASAAEATTPPNIIIIFADDLGYGDLSCYGAEDYETPHLDRMAGEGMKFTEFYVAACVCTPSRAALLTGSHPMRVGLGGPGVLNPSKSRGLHPGEITIAEVLKEKGYRTSCVGKWHLGHQADFLPTKQGFDEYVGIPYSNDMGNHYYGGTTDYLTPPLPVMRGEEIIETDPDQALLTRRWTEEAVAFIDRQSTGTGKPATGNGAQPFFLYLAHAMPHSPIAVSPYFRNRSPHGIYGDVIAEIDWGVGEILEALVRNGIDENTLVIFTSDNGPVIRRRAGSGYRLGSAGPLRGAKGTTWEGGMREPCVMRWPEEIPAGSVCDELTTAMDLLPTIATIVGAEPPGDRITDGKNILPLLLAEPGATTPHESFLYYRNERLEAVRSGPWKLHLTPRPEFGREKLKPPVLYNLDLDIGETKDVAAENTQVVNRLIAIAEAARVDLGDIGTGTTGNGVRPAGDSGAVDPQRFPAAIEAMGNGKNKEALEEAVRKSPRLPHRRRDIVWAEVEGEELKLDAFWPAGYGPFPIVVWIHGGGWRAGFKELGEATCRSIAARGYAVLSVNYRLAPSHPFPAAVNDCLGAVVWAKKNADLFYGDPDRIAVAGESAGGHLAAMVAYASDFPLFTPTGAGPGDPDAGVDAVIPVYGVFDFSVPIPGRAGQPARRSPVDIFLQSDDPLVIATGSPIAHLRRGAPPTLLVVGDADRLYPQTTLLVEKLEATGVEHDLFVAPGSDHAFIVWEWESKNSQDAFKRMGDFLDARFKGQ